MKRHSAVPSGFTLIELLIVVAIIAILAAIAVPNFLEAQTRAKVSRAKADHRTISTGLEMYKIDTNKYPWCNGDNLGFATRSYSNNGQKPTLERLTTPISYLTGEASFLDPFKAKGIRYEAGLGQKKPFTAAQAKKSGIYWYTARNSRDSAVWDQTAAHDVDPYWWFLQSAGPDGYYDYVYYVLNTFTSDTPVNRARIAMTIYDASNGTVSEGSVWRAGGNPTGYGTSMYHVIQAANN
jgi:prepilin-type N-terminal cleavage/methylation domain-containing protein